MKQCPETPTLDEASALAGHVWIQELPTGGTFRFQVDSSGLVTFATADRAFETVGSVPMAFRRAATTISEQLDWEALRAATDDPGDVTFCGIATWNEGIKYVWDHVPPFVGTDVWSGRKARFLSPDAATSVFRRLGLPTLPAIEKEQPAAHTDFTQFEDASAFPQSAWRDGAAAGVLIRDKSGSRVAAWRPDRTGRQPPSTSQSATDLAAAYATADRIEATITALRDDGQSLTVDAIRDRLVADVTRESYASLFSEGEFISSPATFQSAVAERVQRHQSTTD